MSRSAATRHDVLIALEVFDMTEYNEKNTHKYDDIINMEYPLKNHDETRHPRMPVEDRAKIFSAFSALKGYDEEIKERQKRKNMIQ